MAATKEQIDRTTRALATKLVDAIKAALDGEKNTLSTLFENHCRNPEASAVFTASALEVALHQIHQLKAAKEAAHKWYQGTWDGTKVYGEGMGVTYDGSIWIAKAANVSRRPGNGESPWTCSVKHGRDGKDGAPGRDGRDAR